MCPAPVVLTARQSSLRIVPIPCALVIVALVAFERLTKKISLASGRRSP